MISKYVRKGADNLTIKDVEVGNKFSFITFNESDSSIMVNHETGLVNCDCENGSNVGINNKQICKHKVRFVEDYMEGVKTLLGRGLQQLVRVRRKGGIKDEK